MRPAAVALILLGLALSACGEEEAGGSRALRVVVTTTQLGDLARQITDRETVEVTQILSPNADPHDYEPRPSDARSLEQADLVIRSGGDVDEWLSELIESSGTDAVTVEVSKSVQQREDDPHWWQDLRNAVRAVGVIEAGLTEVDPDGRIGYDRTSDVYIERLRKLDSGVARCIGKLPRGARKLVTTHDALGYYADRYGLAVIGAVIPSLSSQAQPSSKGIGELVGQIRKEKVKAIFPEASLSSKLEDAVSRESGASVGGELWADTLGPEGSSGATYIDSIASNTQEIVKGLSGGEVSCRPRA